MNVATDPEHRGRGIATMLLERLFELTSDDARRGYTLEVRVSNATAIVALRAPRLRVARHPPRLLHGQPRRRPDHVERPGRPRRRLTCRNRPRPKASPYADRCYDFLADPSRLTTGHVRTARQSPASSRAFSWLRARRVCVTTSSRLAAGQVAWPTDPRDRDALRRDGGGARHRRTARSARTSSRRRRTCTRGSAASSRRSRRAGISS